MSDAEVSYQWNYDIAAAKTQGRVLVCADHNGPVKAGAGWVGYAWWIINKENPEGRWVNLAFDQKPLCWMKPVHVMEKESSDE